MESHRIPTSIPIALLRKYDRPGPRYTSYPTAPVWSDKVGNEDYRTALTRSAELSKTPLALYCHIPFCHCRCLYCGCNTYITRNSERISSYVDLMCEEIDSVADLLRDRTVVSQLHFGGGTPTFLDIAGMNRLLDKLEERFTFSGEAEKSLEVDPRVTRFEQLDYLVSRGFNRISVGVQDLDPDVQEAIGRIQSYDLIRGFIEYCRKLKFKGINFDLIYGLPRQTPESFKKTITEILTLRPDRLAVYSFAYLPDLKAHQKKLVPEELPSAEQKYELFASAVEMFTGAGYRQIGMDHFALPEDELAVAQRDGRLHRNFMGYTVQAAPEMVGLGMSSIGYVDNSFFQNASSLDTYMRGIQDHGLAVYRGMRLGQDDLIRQYVINQLMCNFKLDFTEFRNRFGVDYLAHFGDEHKRLAEFFEDDLLAAPNGGLSITPVGRTFIRNVAMTFDAYLGKDSGGKKPTFSRTI